MAIQTSREIVVGHGDLRPIRRIVAAKTASFIVRVGTTVAICAGRVTRMVCLRVFPGRGAMTFTALPIWMGAGWGMAATAVHTAVVGDH
jgi:hypothetical protein